MTLLFDLHEAELPTCPNWSGSPKCKCYEGDGQVRCSGNATKILDINPAELKALGSAINSNLSFFALVIEFTNINSIEADTFLNVKFKNVLINHNQNLTSIAKTAIKNVLDIENLVVRNNSKLNQTSLFALIQPLKNTLKNIEFDGNNIKDIASDTFQNFTKLEAIRLDSQFNDILHPVGMKISKKAFTALSKLKLLSLTNNNLTIAEGAIELNDTILQGEETLVVDLTNCNLTITNKSIIFPPKMIPDKANFDVILKKNSLKKLEDGFIDMIANKGYVYLDSNDFTENNCVCSKIKKISAALKTGHIKGIYHHMPCGNVTSILDCSPS